MCSVNFIPIASVDFAPGASQCAHFFALLQGAAAADRLLTDMQLKVSALSCAMHQIKGQSF